MKTAILRIAAATTAALLLACAPTQRPETTRVLMSSSAGAESLMAGEVLSEVNRYRGERGAKPLVRHEGLDRLAHKHAEYLRANRGTFKVHGPNVSHDGFEQRAALAQFRHGFGEVAENVAACHTTRASTIIRLWSQSSAHEKTMRASYNRTGIASVIDADGMVFTVQLFGSLHHSHTALADRFAGF